MPPAPSTSEPQSSEDDAATAQEHFWELAALLLVRPGAEKGTMMGFPCVRRNGEFLACVHRASGDLIVKLDRQDVGESIEAGVGQPFAPNGRVFKEWLAVPYALRASWPAQLELGWDFAGRA